MRPRLADRAVGALQRVGQDELRAEAPRGSPSSGPKSLGRHAERDAGTRARGRSSRRRCRCCRRSPRGSSCRARAARAARPSRSMARAGRSFTLPPGFRCSALARRRRPGTSGGDARKVEQRRAADRLEKAHARSAHRPGRRCPPVHSFHAPEIKKPAGHVRRARCRSGSRSYRGQTPAPAGPSRALPVQQQAVAALSHLHPSFRPGSASRTAWPERDAQHRAGAGDFTGPGTRCARRPDGRPGRPPPTVKPCPRRPLRTSRSGSRSQPNRGRWSAGAPSTAPPGPPS